MAVCNEGEDTYFDKVLKSALYHGRREKRREMIYILGELRDPRALDALTIMNEDDSYFGIRGSKGSRKDRGPKVIDLLLIMMHHPSFIVRSEVANTVLAMQRTSPS